MSLHHRSPLEHPSIITPTYLEDSSRNGCPYRGRRGDITYRLDIYHLICGGELPLLWEAAHFLPYDTAAGAPKSKFSPPSPVRCQHRCCSSWYSKQQPQTPPAPPPHHHHHHHDHHHHHRHPLNKQREAVNKISWPSRRSSPAAPVKALSGGRKARKARRAREKVVWPSWIRGENRSERREDDEWARVMWQHNNIDRSRGALLLTGSS